MNKQLKVADFEQLNRRSAAVVFDRAFLMYQAMQDASLAQEVLQLFHMQIGRLEREDWAAIDLGFEMHTLRGSASAVGAAEIAAIAQDWSQHQALRPILLEAFARFRVAAF